MPWLDGLHGQRDADKPGGSRPAPRSVSTPRAIGGEGTHALGVGTTLCSGGGVGVAAAHQHGGGAAAGDPEVVPADLDRCRRSQVGGEPAAAGTGAPSSVATRARSSTPDALIPTCGRRPRSPRGVVMLMGTAPPAGARSLGKAEGDVDTLDGLARRPFTKLSMAHRATTHPVRWIHSDGDVGTVGPGRRLGRRRGRSDHHERLDRR